MRVEEKCQKLIEAIKETERSTQRLADKAAGKELFDFYEGMACGYRYCLSLLEIWRPRILGEEESEE